MNTLQPQHPMGIGLVPPPNQTGAPLIGTMPQMISPPASVGNVAMPASGTWPLQFNVMPGNVPGSAFSSAPSTPRQGEVAFVYDSAMGMGPLYMTPSASGTNTPNAARTFGGLGMPGQFGQRMPPFSTLGPPPAGVMTWSLTPTPRNLTPLSSAHASPVQTPQQSPTRTQPPTIPVSLTLGSSAVSANQPAPTTTTANNATTVPPSTTTQTSASTKTVKESPPTKRKACIIEKGEHTGIITPAGSPPPHRPPLNKLGSPRKENANDPSASPGTRSPLIRTMDDGLCMIDEEHDDEIPEMEMALSPHLKQSDDQVGAVSVIPEQHTQRMAPFNPQMQPAIPQQRMQPTLPPPPPLPHMMMPPPVQTRPPVVPPPRPAPSMQPPPYFHQPRSFGMAPPYAPHPHSSHPGHAPPPPNPYGFYYGPHHPHAQPMQPMQPLPPNPGALHASAAAQMRYMQATAMSTSGVTSNGNSHSIVTQTSAGNMSSVSSGNDDAMSGPKNNVEGAIEKLKLHQLRTQQDAPPQHTNGQMRFGNGPNAARQQDSKIDRVRREYNNSAVASHWECAQSSETNLHSLKMHMSKKQTGLLSNLRPVRAKFFVIKSFGEDDVHKSIKYNVWCSTEKGNAKLNEAWQDRCKSLDRRPSTPSTEEELAAFPIYLFYSVNRSGRFCGIARLDSGYDHSKSESIWMEDGKWNGKFAVSWFIVKDVPNSHLKHICLPNNDNKPVTYSRDTQEIPYEQGLEVLKTFCEFHSSQSLLDNYLYYDKREDQMNLSKQAIGSAGGGGGRGGGGSSSHHHHGRYRDSSWRGRRGRDGGRSNHHSSHHHSYRQHYEYNDYERRSSNRSNYY